MSTLYKLKLHYRNWKLSLTAKKLEPSARLLNTICRPQLLCPFLLSLWNSKHTVSWHRARSQALIACSFLHRIPLYYPVSQKFAWNGSISYDFPDIYIFHFPLKFNMAAKSGEKLNFDLMHRILLKYPVGQKFAWNGSISTGYWDFCNFLFSAKI